MKSVSLAGAALLFCGALAGVPAQAEEGLGVGLTPLAQCGAPLALDAPFEMASRIVEFQALTEEVLSLRASAIDYLDLLKARDARGEPLSGGDLRRLNEGAAALLDQRRRLLAVATERECWLDQPIPDDPARARVQAAGVAISLAAALMLYDNYLSAVGLYRANPFLRQHLNSRDSGFAIPRGALNRIALSFNSAVNRARTRRAVDWYEAHAGMLAGSADDGERYLSALIEQSPSYQMVRQVKPLGYVGNMLGFFSAFSVDTLNRLQKEGVNLSSLLFGNAAGLVETRRGKLDGQAPVLAKLAGTVQAGDVLLEKTPFRLTDTFIPGHYGHVAVWVGSEAELRQLGIWEHPVVRPHQAKIRAGRGVVEALRAGVKMNTLAHFLNIDDLAVLRPRRIDSGARAEAVLQTLRQVGKAYDFNFDVESTDRIVCSELVYHAYGDVRWPTRRQFGRVTISPDNVAAEATGDGSFAVELLYHDGKEQVAERGEFLRRLLKSEVVRMARGEAGAR